MLRYNDDIEKLMHNNIVLFGASNAGKKIKKALSKFNIDVKYFCDNDPNKQGIIVDGTKVIDLEKLVDFFNGNFFNTIIIISSQYSSEIEKQLLKNGIKENVYSYMSIIHILNLLYFRYYREDMVYYHKGGLINVDLRLYFSLLEALKNKYLYDEEVYLIYSMPKTGTNSIVNTLRKKYNKNVIVEHGLFGYSNISYLKTYYKKSISRLDNSIKVINILREPLSRNISMLFEMYETSFNEVVPYSDYENLQVLFNRIFIYNNIREKPCGQQPILETRFKDLKLIDNEKWFNDELKINLNLDVFEFPFDKEKGYTVINLEGGGNF